MKRSKWTQVDNAAPNQGLPVEGGPYLAVTTGGGMVVAFPPVGASPIYDWRDRYGNACHVVWWRPLPKGPKV